MGVLHSPALPCQPDLEKQYTECIITWEVWNVTLVKRSTVNQILFWKC